ncbi:MAG: AAA family ATPase [Planctomycetes bacterium]|nr:AAA family ATPase [Planctomycetota bacterium]
MKTTEAMYNVPTEETMLASIICDNEIYLCSDLRPEYFTRERKIIFDSISKTIKAGKTADLLSVSTDLKGQIDVVDIIRISDSPISVNIEQDTERLKKCADLQRMYAAYGKALEDCKSGGNPSEIYQNVQIETTCDDSGKIVSMEDVCHSVMDEISGLIDGGKPQGLSSGIRELDRIVGGFMGNEFVIIAGRPGDGKTALGMNIARNMGHANIPGQIFSLEMTAPQITKRLVCDIGHVPGEMLFQQKIAHKDNHSWRGTVRDNLDVISTMPFEIDDSAIITMDQIYARCKKAKMTRGIKWVLIDYLGLIAGWNKEGQGPKAEITRQMKVLAKDIDATIIVLCQMNRKIEDRATRNPKMSDLRDAGSIEQDADIALFPMYFKEETHGPADTVPAMIHVVKNRKGATGIVSDIVWDGQYFRYSDKNNHSYQYK